MPEKVSAYAMRDRLVIDSGAGKSALGSKGVPAEEGFRQEPLFALGLDLSDPKNGAARCHLDTFFVCQDNGARRRICFSVYNLG